MQEFIYFETISVYIHAILFIRTSKFWLSPGLFLIFSIHLLKILAKSQPGCSYKVCSYKEKACTAVYFCPVFKLNMHTS